MKKKCHHSSVVDDDMEVMGRFFICDSFVHQWFFYTFAVLIDKKGVKHFRAGRY